MLSLAADLHLHSCLSPCGDEDMTPNNIVNMAKVKGLQMIALTDHNTTRNLPAISKCAQREGLLFIPGIEVQSQEDVHLVCYFPSLKDAMEFGGVIEDRLGCIWNRPELFGTQIIRNEEDEEIGQIDKLLLQSVPMDINEIYDMALLHGGICVPAHINRESNSLLYILGFLPEEPPFPTVELSPKASAPSVDLQNRRVLYNSDAHYLWDIFEADNFIRLEEPTAQAFVNKYATGRV